MARLVFIGVILIGEFIVLEAGLRMFGGTESAPAFQSLFMPDDRIGYRLRPGTSIRYSTSEFSTDLTINPQGVRDDQDILPKAPDERRVLILGDSYVFAVQVPLVETVGERLERRLNQWDPVHRWRVINGGVQGYGPVEQWLFYQHVASSFDPDIVLIVVSVANDAIEAFDARAKFELGRVPDSTPDERRRLQLRSIVRSSMVLQLVRVRLDQLRARTTPARSERPLAVYLELLPPFASEGLKVATRAFQNIATQAANSGSRVVLVLMPARFQIHDGDFRRLSKTAEGGGATLIRNAATKRFTNALKPVGAPMLDLLPVFESLDDPPDLYFPGNTHLSARGHRVAADAILEFLQANRLTAATAP